MQPPLPFLIALQLTLFSLVFEIDLLPIVVHITRVRPIGPIYNFSLK